MTAFIKLTPLATLALCPLVLAGGFGQPGSPYGTGGPITNDQQIAGPLATGTVTKAVVGDLDGDGRLDALILRDGVACLVPNPECYNTLIPTGFPANDTALLSSSAWERDRLVTVGSLGLQMHLRNPVENTWIPQTASSSPSAWIDAGLVATGFVDMNNTPDIVGVAANGNTVLVEEADGTGGFNSSSFLAGVQIGALMLINWDDDGKDEIVTINPYGIKVFRNNGSLVNQFLFTGGPVNACPVDVVGGMKQLLAVTFDHPTSGLRMVTLGHDNGLQGPFALGSQHTVSGITSAGGDVFLSMTSVNKIWKFSSPFVAGQTANFGSADNYSYGPHYRDPILNSGAMACGDYDRDGDLDLLAFITPNATANVPILGAGRLLRNSTNDHRDRIAAPSGIAYPVTSMPPNGDTTGTISLRYNQPVQSLAHPTGSAGPYTRELLVMLRPTNSYSNLEVTTALGLGEHVFVPMNVDLDNNGTTDPTVTCDLDLPNGYSLNSLDDLLYVISREVYVDANGDIVSCGPSERLLIAVPAQITDANRWNQVGIMRASYSALLKNPTPLDPDTAGGTCDFPPPPSDDMRDPCEPDGRP